MKAVIISVVRDFVMYDKCIVKNPNCQGCEIVALDNREKNDGIGVCYNRVINSRSADEDAWYIFCHEDFEPLAPLTNVLNGLDKNALWGPIGASTKVILGLYHKWQLIGQIEECKKDGTNIHKVGSSAPIGTNVETFDCQCLVVHSSLIQKHNLRFDENLTFDLYVEDFCIAAHEKARIESRILPISARHWSGGSVQPRYYTQESYLNRKYPNACYTGTSSWSIGGKPPAGRILGTIIKRLFKKIF